MPTIKKSPMAILRDFFGKLPGQSLQDFAAEVKNLSAEEKEELVTLAAKELGVEIDKQ